MENKNIIVVASLTIIILALVYQIYQTQTNDESNVHSIKGILAADLPKPKINTDIDDNHRFTNQEPEDSVDGDHEKRIITPYTKALPPQPAEEEARYGFPDVNNNKVRDDIEILIVEEFKDDEMLVEALFTESKTTEYDLYLAREGLLTRENIEFSMKNVSLNGACRRFYYSDFYQHEKGELGSYKFAESVFDKYLNTPEKKRLMRITDRASHGYPIRVLLNPTHSECISFFESTHNLTY